MSMSRELDDVRVVRYADGGNCLRTSGTHLMRERGSNRKEVGEFKLGMQQGNSFSLQRSEMFIATSAHVKISLR